MSAVDLTPGEHSGELFRALIFGDRRLLLPSAAVKQVDAPDQPRYRLDANLQVTASPQDAACTVRVASEVGALFLDVDRLDLLFGDLQFVALPACMVTATVPVAVLSLREETADWVCDPQDLVIYVRTALSLTPPEPAA